MRWFSFTVFAATLVILASLSLAVAVPTRTTNGVVPRALKQYKMKRPGVNVQRDVSDEGNAQRKDAGQHYQPRPSYYWNPTTTTTQQYRRERETSV